MPSAASQAHAAGQKKPSKFSGVGNYFSIYEYMKDPFERHKAATIEERRKGKELWVGSEDFKTTALPQVPRNAGSFDEFKYTIDPYEQKDEYQKLMKKKSDSKILHGPVRAGGTVSDNELTKIRSNEAIDRLDRMLRKDWDDAFVDVFEDVSGCIVMCFGADRGRGHHLLHEPHGAGQRHREGVQPEEGREPVGGDGRRRPAGVLRLLAAVGAQEGHHPGEPAPARGDHVPE